MYCPKCNNELEIFARGGKELLICPQCFSALLPDESALKTLKYFCKQEIIGHFISNLLEDTLCENTKRMLAADNNLLCPRCKSRMHSHDFNNKLNFYVNKCPGCGAVWINQMQIPLVALSFAGNQPEDESFKKTVTDLYAIMSRKKPTTIRSFDELIAPFVVMTGLAPALPAGDSVLTKTRPIVSYAIIVMCSVIFILQIMFSEIISSFSLIPDKVTHGEWYRLITHAFLHGGILHLAGNMFFLRVFGRSAEDRLGWARYALLFIVGAAISGILYMATSSMKDMPCVGASGAISAVIGAYLILFPKAKLRFYLIHPISLGKSGMTQISSLYYILFWIVMNIFFGALQSGSQTADIAYWGHIGGFIAGVVFAEAYKSLRPG